MGAGFWGGLLPHVAGRPALALLSFVLEVSVSAVPGVSLPCALSDKASGVLAQHGRNHRGPSPRGSIAQVPPNHWLGERGRVWATPGLCRVQRFGLSAAPGVSKLRRLQRPAHAVERAVLPFQSGAAVCLIPTGCLGLQIPAARRRVGAEGFVDQLSTG